MPEIQVGSAPDTIAIIPGSGNAHGMVFAANINTNSVTVIDDTTYAILATIPVGSTPVGIATSSDKKIYVANFNSNSVTAINPTNIATPTNPNPTNPNPVIATIPVGKNPVFVGSNPLSPGIAVANFASGDITTIDPSTNKGTQRTVGAGANPLAIACLRGIWASAIFDNNVVMLSGGQYTTTPVFVPVGGTYPVDIVAASGNFYVANAGTTNISAISLPLRGAPTASPVQVGNHPVDIAVNTATNMIYVANFDSNSITVIDSTKIGGTTNPFVTEIPLNQAGPLDIAVSPTNKKVYVANFGSNSVSIIDATTNTLKTNVPVGVNPFYVTVNPTNGDVYVANFLTNNVSVIDGVSDTAKQAIQTGAPCVAIAPMTIAVGITPVVPGGGTNRVYIANTAIAVSP
ncbi:MAG: YncE family protein [Chloroflexota bacterium]|nr:YncE family protein [Chloroflexota bacterium]